MTLVAYDLPYRITYNHRSCGAPVGGSEQLQNRTSSRVTCVNSDRKQTFDHELMPFIHVPMVFSFGIFL